MKLTIIIIWGKKIMFYKRQCSCNNERTEYTGIADEKIKMHKLLSYTPESVVD